MTADDLRTYALAQAQAAGIDPALVDAIGQTESNWSPSATSPKGAIGPMQLMPATAKSLGVDPTNPQANIRGGIAYLKQLTDQFNGDPTLVAAAYNAGPGAVAKAGGVPNFPETQNYVKKVQAKMTIDPAKVTWDDAPIDTAKVQWDQAPTAASNLGGTLQLGIPFTGARLDTGIPLPQSIEAGIVAAGKTTSDWINGVRQMLPGGNAKLDASVSADNAAYDPLAKQFPIATTVGQGLPYFATGSSIPAMMGLSALGYGSPEERAMRAGAAGVGGVAGNFVGRLFGPASMAGNALGDASDFASYAASQGNKWGIPTTAGMNGSKTAQLAESVISNLPFVNGGVNAARSAAFGGFNRAVNNTIGEDSAQITPELLGIAKARAGGTIGDIAGRSTMNVSPTVTAGLDAVRARISNELVGDPAALATKWLDQVEAKIAPSIDASGQVTGIIPGDVYKSIDSQLGQAAKANQGTVANVLGDLRAILRDGMDASISPADAQAWQTARRQYFNVNQVANATKATPGSLSPSQLLTQVNAAQRNARFGGGNDLAELAQWAKPTLTDQIPNSGTPQRLLMQKLLTNPLTGVAELAGGAYAANETGHPYLAGSLGLLGPLMVGRAVAGRPLSAATQNLLMRLGGTTGLLGYGSSTP